MSMIHTYTLFDKKASEHVWRLKWSAAVKNPPSGWFTSKTFERGAYDFDSGTLRGLLSFSVDPEPTDEEIESILENETIAATMGRCHPQFWTMEEVLRRFYPRRKRTADAELSDCSCLVSVMSRAFLEERITASQMWSVVKLHNLGANSWLAVDVRVCQRMRELPWSSLWKPVFAWQNEDACQNDESTNCLSVTQTRQFCALVGRAYEEDWKMLAGTDNPYDREIVSFKGNPESVSFARSLARGFARFEHPSMYRTLM